MDLSSNKMWVVSMPKSESGRAPLCLTFDNGEYAFYVGAYLGKRHTTCVVRASRAHVEGFARNIMRGGGYLCSSQQQESGYMALHTIIVDLRANTITAKVISLHTKLTPPRGQLFEFAEAILAKFDELTAKDFEGEQVQKSA